MPKGATAALKDEESSVAEQTVSAVAGAAGILDSEGALPFFMMFDQVAMKQNLVMY